MNEAGIVEVRVRVAVAPATVITYFTDPTRYVEWMGSHAVLDAVVGGVYRVRMNDGFQAAGIFVQVDPPSCCAFTWGWAEGAAARHVRHDRSDVSGDALRPGSTRVAVNLTEDSGGTIVTLRHHDLRTGQLRDAHAKRGRCTWAGSPSGSRVVTRALIHTADHSTPPARSGAAWRDRRPPRSHHR